MSSGTGPTLAPKAFRDDETLVRECLLGASHAWSELIGRYQNLIYSIPVKYGMPPEEAAEIFQAVCFTVLHELEQLRQPRALQAWLMRLTAHKCIRWKREQRRFVGPEIDLEQFVETSPPLTELLQQVESEQILRESIREATPECQRLIELLFFADPPLRYDAAAHALGLAKDSMGATRGRCLDKLRRSLEAKGFR